MEAELEDDEDVTGKKGLKNDEKVFGKDKDVTQLDPFFVEAEGAPVTVTPAAIHKAQIEKREVMRDGRVPKFQHNMEKIAVKRAEAQARREGWEQKKEEVRVEKMIEARTHRPMKINSAAYGTGFA